MTSANRESPQEKPRPTKAELYGRAASLAVDMALFAEELSQASRQALAATNSSLAETLGRTDWILNNADMVRNTMRSRIENLVRNRELEDDKSRFRFSTDFWGSLKYYDHHDLAKVYDAAHPRASFVADVCDWTGRMAEAGWPLIANINAAPDDCVVLTVFDDTPAVRTDIQQIIDESRHAPDYESVDYCTYAWIDSRVLLFADSATIGECR